MNLRLLVAGFYDSRSPRDYAGVTSIGGYMSLRFYLGPSGVGKSYRLYEDVLDLAQSQPDKQFFFIVPDQYTMAVQKHLIDKSQAHAITNMEILSFKRLAYKVFEETGAPEHISLDDTGKNLIVRSIALKHRQELTTLGKSLDKIGYIHETKSVISEFMQYGIGQDQLKQIIAAADKKPALKSKLKDIEFIYKEFLNVLSDRYITPEGILALLADKVERSSLLAGSVIILDGFTGFTPIQNRVIERLMAACEHMWIALTIDEAGMKANENSFDLFSLTHKTYERMCKLAKGAGLTLDKEVHLFNEQSRRFAGGSALDFLERNMLRNAASVYEGDDQSVYAFVADNPRAELMHALIKLKKLVRSQGLEYRQCAIVTGDLATYAPYASELFDRYEIPGFVDDTRRIVLNPFIEFIKSSLGIIVSDFSYESIFHFLRSGLADIELDQIDLLDSYVVAMGIRGRRAWTSQFIRYSDDMKEYDRESRSYKVTEESLGKLKAMNDIRSRVMDIISPIMSLKRCKSFSAMDISSMLYDFIEHNQLFAKLSQYADRFAMAKDYPREKEYSQIYDSFMELLDTMAGILASDELTLEEYIKILEAGISELKIGVLPQGVDYVVLGDIERTRLDEIKVLFFLGVNDGIVPKTADAGGIISDLDREFLNGVLDEFDIELAPSPRQKMYIQKLYLYTNMTKPSKALYVSYSKMDALGGSITPSYLIQELKQLLPKLKVEDTSAIAASDLLVGRNDAYSLLAANMSSIVSGRLSEVDRNFFDSLYAALEADNSQRVADIKDGAIYRYTDTRLKPELVKTLYGSGLKISVSRLERFARCAFSHFLSDGLRLAAKQEYSFDSAGVGVLNHDVLKEFASKLSQIGKRWGDLTRQEAEELLDAIVDEAAARYGEGVIFDSGRYAYQLKRIKRILIRCVMSIAYQLKKGRFEPRNMEYSIRQVVDIDKVKVGLSQEEKVILGGSIDRVDAADQDDKLYIKVIDYKSSEKNIDLVSFYRGLNLQLVVYLDSACQDYKKEHPDKQVVPAAMFYYPMIDPMVDNAERDDEAGINAAINKRLRAKGYFADSDTVIALLDQEFETESDVVYAKRLKSKPGFDSKSSHNLPVQDFDNILKYSRKKVAELSEEILLGDIGARPVYERADQNACTYCAYRQSCGFDTRVDGYAYNKTTMKKDEVLDKIRTELEDGGH